MIPKDRLVLSFLLLSAVAGVVHCASSPDRADNRTDSGADGPIDAQGPAAFLQDPSAEGRPTSAAGEENSGATAATALSDDAAEGAEGGPKGNVSGFCGSELLRSMPPPDRVLARVDDREIRASELFQVYFMQDPVMTESLVNGLVIYEIVRKESKRLGVKVKTDEVEAVIDWMIEDQRGRLAYEVDESKTLEEFVEGEYRMNMSAYREMLRDTAVSRLLLERCVRYKEITEKRRRLRVMVFDDMSKASAIHKKLMKGASFETLAREHSRDPSAKHGGLLPPLPGEMDDPLVRASLALDAGGISDVEEISLDRETKYVIITLLETIEPLTGNYETLRGDVEADLRENPLVPVVVLYWKESLKGRYEVEGFAP